jgi:hypothetical protein
LLACAGARTFFAAHAFSIFFANAGARTFFAVHHSFACVMLLACAGARWSARVQQSLAFRALFWLAALVESFGFFNLALDFWFSLHAPI